MTIGAYGAQAVGIAAHGGQAAALAGGCNALLVDAAIEKADGRVLEAPAPGRLPDGRGDHHDRPDGPRHAR